MKERHYSQSASIISPAMAWTILKITTNNSRLTRKLHHSFLRYCWDVVSVRWWTLFGNNEKYFTSKSMYLYRPTDVKHPVLTLWIGKKGRTPFCNL